MRAYTIFFLIMSLTFLALFALVSALDIPWLSDPRPLFAQAGRLGTALLGIGLLVTDVVLPVPATLVMMAHGALFGIYGGAAVSLVGSTLAATVGFALGRRGGRFLHQVVSEEERRRADALLERWGGLAVLVTRPVPILAESVAILAGTSPMPWRRFLPAVLLGNLPGAFLFAAAGATAAQSANGLLAFGLVMLIAAATWLLGRRRGPQTQP